MMDRDQLVPLVSRVLAIAAERGWPEVELVCCELGDRLVKEEEQAKEVVPPADSGPTIENGPQPNISPAGAECPVCAKRLAAQREANRRYRGKQKPKERNGKRRQASA